VASFLLKRVEIRELLAVMTDLDPSLAALGPKGALGRASIWVQDVSLADLRGLALAAVGLSERIEEDRRLLERSGAPTEDVLVPVAGETPVRRLALRPSDLAVAEFELAGVAGMSDQGFRAFAYAPTGALNAYRVGDKLVDGVVRSVDTTDVALDTEEGPLRLLIPPLR
jgi:hypothetical protein